MKHAPTLLIGLPLLLSACSMAPKYEEPAMPVPDGWNGVVVDERPETAVPVSDLPWRAYFVDARLQSVIELALENNRDLRAAALAVEKTRELYRIQRAEFVPDVGLSATGDRYRLPGDLSGTGHAATIEQYSVSLGTVAWEFDLFGRIDSLEDSALETFLAAENTRTAARVSLVSAVAAAYLTLAADSENLALAGDTLAAQKETYDLILKSRDFGMADDLQLKQAQSQVEAARVQQARLLGLVAVDRNALELLTGAPVPESLLPRQLCEVAAPKAVDPGLSSAVLLARPDIMAAEHRLKAANANIGAARAALFPRIALTAAGGSSSGELSGLFESGSKSWRFAPEISVPIFTGGALRASLRMSKVDRELALADYEKTIQTAFREVNDALSLDGTLKLQLAAQTALVDALDATHQLALARWEAGMADYLEVLVAERALFSARQNLIATRLADEVNQVTLYKALGGGGVDAPELAGGA